MKVDMDRDEVPQSKDYDTARDWASAEPRGPGWGNLEPRPWGLACAVWTPEFESNFWFLQLSILRQFT